MSCYVSRIMFTTCLIQYNRETDTQLNPNSLRGAIVFDFKLFVLASLRRRRRRRLLLVEENPIQTDCHSGDHGQSSLEEPPTQHTLACNLSKLKFDPLPDWNFSSQPLNVTNIIL